MTELQLRIEHEAGLHARPLALFVKTAKAFQSTVRVQNLSTGKGPVDGKSPLSLMLLAVQQGHDVRIEAEGPDSDEAVSALQSLIASNFEKEVSA